MVPFTSTHPRGTYTVVPVRCSHNLYWQPPVGDKILSPSKSALYGFVTDTLRRNVEYGSTRTR